MKELWRYELYSELLGNTQEYGITVNSEIYELLSFNRSLSFGLENYVLEKREEEIDRQFSDNISAAKEEKNAFSGISSVSLEKAEEEIKKKKTIASKYNVLIKEITESNDKIIKFKAQEDELEAYKRENRVFLSYSYKDKLYTYALFKYFIRRGVYLYIDWMHNGEARDGAVLRRTLHKEMSQCSQFLFLPTINMSLNLPGNQGVRSWCSWEMGDYYAANSGQDSKFYIDLYGAEKPPLMIDGIAPLKAISDGRLC